MSKKNDLEHTSTTLGNQDMKGSQRMVSVVEPYELPEGWKWVTIKDCFEVTSSRRVLKEDWKDNGIPFYRTRELVKLSENGFVDNELFIEKSYYDELKEKYGVPKIGDLLISGVGTIGVPFVITTEDEFYFKDGNVIWFKNNGKVVPNYIFYLYKSNFIINQIHNMSAGTTVDTYTIINAMNTIIPLPPALAEQQRIVNRIESMFAKLDEAKEKAQNVVDGFETRKAAILHKAFTGELTAKWRKENCINSCEVDVILNKLFNVRDTLIASKTIQKAKVSTDFDERFILQFYPKWKIVKLGSIAFVTKLAGFEYTKYIKLEESGEIPAIRAQNVRKGYLDETNLLYISKDVSEFLQRSALTKNSVLVTFIGAGIGDVCVFNKHTRYHLAPNVAKVEPFNSENEEYINVNYIMYYLISHFGQHEIFKKMKATAQPSLSMETIRDIEIPIPTLPEQVEIVRILDIIIEKENKAKQAAETVLEQIDLLKKSILARAFRGEL